MPVRRFHANEASISRRGIWQVFQDIVKEYLDLEHAEPVPIKDLTLPHFQTYYMPMHAVIKDSSTTTKLRVVFDASARTTSGHSFNETLMTGPTLYPPLTDILMRFQTIPVAMSQRCIGPLTYSQTTGTTITLCRGRQVFTHPRLNIWCYASPFVVIRCLQQTSQPFSQEHNLAQHHVYESFYVDDLLAGASTPEDALQLQQHLRALLLKGGSTYVNGVPTPLKYYH